MAEAIKDTRTTTQTIKVEEEIVVLTMTRPEAEALRAVLARVGGDARYTRRGLTDNISHALYETGISWDTSDMRKGDSLLFLTPSELSC